MPSISSLVTGPVRRLCGTSDILGRAMSPVPGRLRGCGVAEPVRVAEVAGIRLSRPATMDCRTALALRRWVETGVKPAVGRLGGGAVALDVAAGYSCRTRNNIAGAKISEHGRGRAIDISGVRLANGQEIRVLTGWTARQQGQVLRQMHRAACGPFTTVLGPDADSYHRDHFHFDTARGRGAYCR